MTAAETFARWALELRLEDVPERVRHAAGKHLLDGVGCAVAALRTNAIPAALIVARGWSHPEESTVIGSGTSIAAPAAALANGALVHALDYDDTHAGALVHATAAVLPAAFAVSEEGAASGEETLLAVIAAYELVTRLGAAVPHGFHNRSFHATSVCGVFAAALAAARLMKLDENATVNALGIAGSQASGSLEFLETGSSTKQLHPGFAGMSGVMAARLASAGAEGPASIFEGTHGLFRSFLDTTVAADDLTDGLGARWETARITIKPYPACQLSHASLDALRSLGALDTSSIKRIAFSLPVESIAIVCEPDDAKRSPRTPYEGKFSLPYCAAALLLDGSLSIDAFDQRALERPDARALAARVTWEPSGHTGAPADAPGNVEVTLADGSVLNGSVPCSRGGPDAPLSEEELLAKFATNAGTTPMRTNAIAETFFALEKQSGIASVLSSIIAPALQVVR